MRPEDEKYYLAVIGSDSVTPSEFVTKLEQAIPPVKTNRRVAWKKLDYLCKRGKLEKWVDPTNPSHVEFKAVA